jgi:hypothetical protein
VASIIFHVIEEIDHVTRFYTVLLKSVVTPVTVKISWSRSTLGLTVRITPRGLWEINITKKVRGTNINLWLFEM